MIDYLSLDNDNVIVCNPQFHEYLQTNYFKGKLIPFKITSYQEFYDDYLGKLSKKTKKNLIDEGCNPYLAIELINHFLIYHYLNIPCEFQNILLDNLEINKIVQNAYNKKRIIFINPDPSDDLYHLSCKLNNNILVHYEYLNNNPHVKVFNGTNIDEEILYVISNLNSEKTSIYLLSDEYLTPLIKYLDLADIKYNLHDKKSLMSLEYGKAFYDLVSKHIPNNFDEYFSLLEEEYLINDDDKKALIDTVNNTLDYFPLDHPYFLKALYDELLNEIPNKIKEYSNIDIYLNHNIFDNYNDAIITYIIGAYQNNFPKYLRDDDLISDAIRTKYHFVTSINKNEEVVNLMPHLLNNYQTLFITSSSANHHELSTVVYKLKYELDSLTKKRRSISFINNQFVKAYENYLNYYQLGDETKDNDYLQDITYLSNIAIINNYNTFNHLYNGHIKYDNKVLLSATSFEKILNCRYSYYLNYLLRVTKKGDPLNFELGNYYHLCLEKLFSKDFKEQDLDQVTENFIIGYINKYPNDINVNPYFYFKEVHQKRVLRIYHILLDTLNNLKFGINDIKMEYDLKYSFDGDEIEGKIDKIYFFDDKFGIIDYKTGKYDGYSNDAYNKKRKVQLPFYLYLTNKNHPELSIGFAFIQRVLLEEDEFQKTEINPKGIISEQSSELAEMFKNYKSRSTRKSKTMSDSEIANLLSEVEQDLRSSFANIHQGDFKINPFIKDSCKYCAYKYICHHDVNDYQIKEEA